MCVIIKFEGLDSQLIKNLEKFGKKLIPIKSFTSFTMISDFF